MREQLKNNINRENIKNKNKKEKFRIHNRMNQRTSLFGLTELSKAPASIERSNT